MADALGLSRDELPRLFNGDLPITADRAKSLAEIFNASARFWLAREAQYRRDLQALREDARRWISSLPFADMTRFGWLKTANSSDDKFKFALDFFGVSTVDEWRDAWLSEQAGLTAYRTSPVFAAQSASVVAWLRQGEVAAEELRTAPWSREGFEHLLPTLKPLTRVREPAEFIPQLQQRCATCGVAVVIVRTPKGCPASGATRVKNGQAILQLSVRYLRDDSFWFTFFHEAGHLMLHEDRLFLEWPSRRELESHEENEANEFAGKVLIPPSHEAALRALPHEFKSIMRFARDLSISPGVVVGQLQHRGLVPPDKLNFLKKRYSWVE
ncbi:plasmid maintenance system antidote protein VapI [Variovorax paradoxus]|uniref:Plasmid maintenance system antidote protein VapI n=1 Tax=Variovorax paradoxus TaxID=34073 RepID=A0AAE3XXL9_VARPD|nr:ImmA/IrrE family metallo-endopeptidase [Variovorax paradoxus]MDR6426714.1 plasmid maintenance system antidote protein VapI [Variovorax paradoxus]